MKKLYTRFFHIPKHEKIGEKVMLVRVVTTIATIVGCLIAMSLTAYAYFSCDVTSVSNVIQTAKFDAQIAIIDENDTPVEPSTKEGKISTFSFTVPGNYTVTLSPQEDSTAKTGFCVVYVGNETYHTQQIGVDVLANNQNRESVSFTLQVKGAETVKIESHWGTSSHYNYDNSTDNDFYIVESKPLKVIVVGTATDNVDDTKTETTTTTSATTETTTILETSVTQTTGTTEITQTTTFPQTTNTIETTVKTTNAAETTTSSATADSTNMTTTEQTTMPTGEITTTETGTSSTEG